jgi:hypothetical protein
MRENLQLKFDLGSAKNEIARLNSRLRDLERLNEQVHSTMVSCHSFLTRLGVFHSRAEPEKDCKSNSFPGVDFVKVASCPRIRNAT